MAVILVTDDDRACRTTIQRTLEREGYTVEAACDVDGALRALDRQVFDLIVCDYRMPGKSGFDLLVALRDNKPRIPVVMVTANADAAMEMATVRLGAARLLKKPFRRQDLLDTVSQNLGK